MKFFLSNQKNRFPYHLESLKKYSITPYTKKALNHKITSKEIPIPTHSVVPNNKRLFNYDIFPSVILQAYPEWLHESREIRVGDTIVQQIQIPLFKFSLKIIVGVRIKEIFNSEVLKGFSYETLQGHLEQGLSILKMEAKKNYFIFSIETYSSPASFFLKLFKPISLLYQSYCTKRALKYVKQYYLTGALFLTQK